MFPIKVEVKQPYDHVPRTCNPFEVVFSDGSKTTLWSPVCHKMNFNEELEMAWLKAFERVERNAKN